MLAALAAIWGSSFMFITIALRDLAPSTLILLGWAPARARWRLRPTGRPPLVAASPLRLPLALLGLINTAVPFFLIAWGQQYIDSGLAAIFNASAPLFTALFAIPLDRTQRVTGSRLAGVVLGFAGVVLLVGFELTGTQRAVAGGLAVVARPPATGSAASTRVVASPGCRRRSSPWERSSGRRSTCSRSAPRRRACSAGSPWSPCSTSASPRPASRTCCISA
jgi:drug/metabolite transporter (DMT)-like permease